VNLSPFPFQETWWKNAPIKHSTEKTFVMKYFLKISIINNNSKFKKNYYFIFIIRSLLLPSSFLPSSAAL
jgi:hypothetical protein